MTSRNKESTKHLDRLSMRGHMVISATVFWCMIEAILFWRWLSLPPALFVHFFHAAVLRKLLGCTVSFLVSSIVLTVFVRCKLKQ